ncbi:cyclin-C-like isoform X2 [Watersipora subatra]|uniref:cyclin-C-like isoform X2 n=1 Tax=Watersipora subatra TaxID=2589382 RepID=UPI00355B580E
MAGNFWQSSHYTEWILARQDIYLKRKPDLTVLTEEEYQKIMIFFANFIQAIGESMKVPQQVIATATVYFKRFYARSSFKCIDPFLMSPTCILLASKVEDCSLIVFQPYRPLTAYCAELNEDAILPLAWRVVNDSLRTDAALLYPPYLIAIASMHLACVMLQKDCQKWFAELSVDFDKVLEIMQLLLTLYDLWKDGYDEKKDIYSILEKMPKPKTNPNPAR